MLATRPRPPALVASLFAAALAVPAAAQAGCNPQLTSSGTPCICSTVTYTLTDNAGCYDLMVISFDPTPVTVPGVIALPAAPPYFVVATGVGSAGFEFQIPCQLREIGVPVTAFGVAIDSALNLYVSPPVAYQICGAEVGDTVFCDTNNNGNQDPGEPGIAGVAVTIDCGPGFDPQTATTDADGHYRITDLPLLPCMLSVDPATVPLRKVPGITCPTELDVDLATLGPVYLDADFCYVDCNPCKGGVTKLRLRYTGATTAAITVRENGGAVVFMGPVEPNGTFAFQGVASDLKLGTNTTVFVDGVPTVIHTSCSQPIGPGSVFGPLTVVAGESKDNGPMCAESPCAAGKPCSITLRYTGESCAATNNSMDPGKVTCSGDPAFASPVRVLSTDNSNPYASAPKVWFDGMVNLGDTFMLESYNAGQSKLANDTYVYVFDASGALLQSVKFHTSCSQPIIFGDQYGSMRLEAYSAEGQCSNPNLCGQGLKPCSLTLRYTGDSCAATNHQQDPSKVSCTGDPMFATLVRLRASNKANPTDTSAKVWFDGPVMLNETAELLAANAGANRLENDTWIHVFDTADVLLQTVKFHTSCSQPLEIGNQFGSVRLEAFVPEGQCGGGGTGNPDLCSAGGRPQTITMRYTGESCSASSNNQDPSKWSCTGDPMMAPIVTMLVTDNADPASTSAHVWFQGVVDLNNTFVISALTGGATQLATNTYAYIYDGTTLVQSIRFHTSCSQPLAVDDQWGSLRLVGLTLN